MTSGGINPVKKRIDRSNTTQTKLLRMAIRGVEGGVWTYPPSWVHMGIIRIPRLGSTASRCGCRMRTIHKFQ
jgi:hypothetical protein